MMWDFWVITGKLRVVFKLGNFGVTEGFQIVYREEVAGLELGDH